MMQQDFEEITATSDLSALLISLLKGVQYREQNELQWSNLLNLQTRVRDYVAVLNLELVIDESEGYAFLKSCPKVEDDHSEPYQQYLPRLIARRPLSFPVSLLLALLRKKLAEFDTGESGTRLVLSRDEIVELVRVFLPEGSNEARLVDQIESTINKVIELGFLHKLKAGNHNAAGQQTSYEVRRILKAFVDAQWLAEFDAHLAVYQSALAEVAPAKEVGEAEGE
ncbi:DUF4194 domain-containing protein [Nitrosomonas sp.]|uniref:DUF4194 domain-containing protein n=1 Tax=Nitrosomonas sp. TaxID=42353 RepID=UPI0033068558